MSRRWFGLMLLSCALGLSLSLRSNAETPSVLRVSAIPDEAPTELLRKFEPLGAYLQKELGITPAA